MDPTHPIARLGLFLLATAASAAASAEPFGEPAAGCRLAGAEVSALPAPMDPVAAFPPPQLQVHTPVPPAAVPSAGRDYLIHELHLRNFSDGPMDIRGLEVLSGEQPGATPLATFQGRGLQALVSDGHAGYDGHDGHDERGVALPAGGGTVVFLCLAFDGTAPVPASLRHRLVLRNGVVDGPRVEIPQAPLPVLAPPVSGPDWFAAGGPGNISHHRRGPIVMGGTVRISRRYAIDWRQVKDGASFAGDARDVRSHHAYGQEVLAVADGTVVDARDGLPDNVPRTAAGFTMALPLTAETIAGNHVVLDIGEGRFAHYAHLQPDSVQVGVGDRVRAGQVLGRIGNSGDAREPHLHFQLTDGPHILASEGLPHVIDRYRLGTGAGEQERRGELPVWGARVDFTR